MAASPEITIDAEGKSLGRVASLAAKTLMGKTSPAYTPNIEAAPNVKIVNAKKLAIRERKSLQKKYTRYTGYPGGFKIESLGRLSARKGRDEAVRRAVERMLPRNALRKPRMKKLTITE